ncbi:NAD(+) diphosphatase [Leucobacter manosquensis]|uniref:NAD(+) diphosphatase n=1 Tax=Leucobacter manosquensis TaxID=2810611 RepID=A0ABS5M1R2_9MICO|nr:NAD(+) diphosphatase [Leucobacter manosquensis]MBS3180905.1 NAD(+) diphosphatase [Leucobacter manosquensis]
MTSNPARPPLAGGALDRDAATRMSQELLGEAWRDPSAKMLRIRGVEIPVRVAGGATRLAWQPTTGEPRAAVVEDPEGASAADQSQSSLDARGVTDVFLGRIDGAPVFARAIPVAGEDPGTDARTVENEGAGAEAEPGDERWVHPFQVGARLTEAEREAVGVASALLRWHESASYSPRDGDRTAATQGGWARLDARGGEHFPRTDPAVIVLIEHENRVLLGSNALWEPGRFSLLAGFVEAGESLEQAVQREVFEESGVRLGDIAYVTSQPWPFPRSLMLGFRARLAAGVDPEALVPDPTEISELRWFTRDELREPAEDLTLPMPLSIARWMIDRWVAEDDAEGAVEPVDSATAS